MQTVQDSLTTDLGATAAAPLDTYGSESITVLEGLEAVRKRPGMYIGDVHDGSGLHHLVWEARRQRGRRAPRRPLHAHHVTIHFDGSVTVEDNGRGIPVGIMQDRGVSAAEVVMTVLHAGGKFDNSSYKVSAGLHGVGVSAVNAVREWLKLEIKREGKRLVPGVPARRARRTRSSAIGDDRQDRHEDHVQARHGDLHQHRVQLRHPRQPPARALVPQRRPASSTCTDERGDGRQRDVFEYKGGIREFVALLNKTKEPVHDEVIALHRASARSASGKPPVAVEVALQWNDALHRADLLLHEQRPQQGRRHAPHRPAHRAHQDAQHLRHGAEPLQGAQARPHRRGHARGPHRVISVKHPDPSASTRRPSPSSSRAR